MLKGILGVVVKVVRLGNILGVVCVLGVVVTLVNRSESLTFCWELS